MKNKLTPVQTLLLGYILLILIGGILLTLPFSAHPNNNTEFIDALFTSASAVSTTGLIVVDTGTHYTIWGQVIILILFQIGGLGYMIFIALISISIGFKFSINGKKLISESVARPTSIEVKKFVKAVTLFTLVFEFIGTVVLTIVFEERMPFSEALYSAVFHSISAFCTAGFSLYADSFIPYVKDITVNIILAVVTLAGSIGFFVLYDLSRFIKETFQSKKPKISEHSRLVLVVSFLLIMAGTIILFFSEHSNEGNLSYMGRILTASFQALSASTTTGFNSVDIGLMRPLSLIVIIVPMFIGASPGGTGGGIKTSTFGIVILFIKKTLSNKKEVSVFKRTIDELTVNKAITISTLGVFYTFFVVVILSVTENHSIMKILFETTSALGTVGLSMGITSSLSIPGKFLIIVTMLVGRVGPLAIGYSLIGKILTKKYSYPNGNFMTG